jgi:hypothetical protein
LALKNALVSRRFQVNRNATLIANAYKVGNKHF